MPPEVVADGEGAPRLLIGRSITFRRLVGVSFDQIRQNAGHHTYVYVHLLEALARVVACSDGESRLGPIQDQARLVLERAEQVLPQEADLEVVRERYADLLEEVGRAREERATAEQGR